MLTEITNAGLPDESLRVLNDSTAQRLSKVLSEPLFTYHVNKRGHEDATTLFDRIAPLIQHRRGDAWLAIADVVKAAHDLALKMFSGPYQFRYGHANEYDVFDPSTMVDTLHLTDDVDPQTFDPTRPRFRVEFATTPSMFFRRMSNSAPRFPDFPEVVSLIQVLLRDFEPQQG